jgi:hypothetical protein
LTQPAVRCKNQESRKQFFLGILDEAERIAAGASAGLSFKSAQVGLSGMSVKFQRPKGDRVNPNDLDYLLLAFRRFGWLVGEARKLADAVPDRTAADLAAELSVARMPYGTSVQLKRWNRLKAGVLGREGTFEGAAPSFGGTYLVRLSGDSFPTAVGWQDIVIPHGAPWQVRL